MVPSIFCSSLVHSRWNHVSAYSDDCFHLSVTIYYRQSRENSAEYPRFTKVLHSRILGYQFSGKKRKERNGIGQALDCLISRHLKFAINCGPFHSLCMAIYLNWNTAAKSSGFALWERPKDKNHIRYLNLFHYILQQKLIIPITYCPSHESRISLESFVLCATHTIFSFFIFFLFHLFFLSSLLELNW